MAYENIGSNLPGIDAGADLTGDQFRGVVIDSTGRAVVATAGTQAIDGVLQNKPAEDEPAAIWGPGSATKVIVGTGGATRGVQATPASDGLIDASTGDIVSGTFLETGVAGTTVSMWIGPGAGGAAV
jgi:hypothetical protein